MQRLFCIYSILLVVITAFSSCYVNKNFTYFKTLNKDTTINAYVLNFAESKIKKNDLVAINVSSLNAEIDANFNNSSKVSLAVATANSQNSNPGYLVDEKGEINIHHLGYIKIEGLTLKELKLELEKDLQPFMKEPIVSIQYLNKKVTVMGEFNNPHVMNMTEDQMPLLDVIVNSGELKENANVKDIIIIRDSGSKKIVKHVNLEDHSIFSSEWYYVKTNDIVYVKKDTKLINKEERRQQVQTTFSLLASLLSIGVVIVNLLIK